MKDFSLEKVRVRFAPSPTGRLHIGSARTALFNFLFARNQKGVFILRIEDTDKERSKKEYEIDILESLKWLQLNWDEGPYYQSQRIALYKKYLEKLIEEKKAYYCFCKKEELEQMKNYQLSTGQAPRYPGKCRSLTEKEVEEKLKNLKEEEGVAIRLKTNPVKIKVKDLIRGKIEFNSELLGDFVIGKYNKKEGFWPVYNFAVVVDDVEMQVSHIIRGEDHLPNTPKQLLIYQALGFKEPQFAHLPLILGPDRSKLSKRHGAVAVSDYQKEGYLPEAIINFIALLGWNPGSDRELYDLSSLIKDFSLKRIQKSAAVFNLQKLNFFNRYYLRQKTSDQLLELAIPYFEKAGYLKKSPKENLQIGANGSFLQIFQTMEGKPISLQTLKEILNLCQERIDKVSDLIKLTEFFFKEPEYDRNLLSWKEKNFEKTKKYLEKTLEILKAVPQTNWTIENIKNIIMTEAEKTGEKGEFLWSIRVALTGKEGSPPFFDIAKILGKEKTLQRLQKAIEKI
jgi:nondiscriminating glutamyl-tRNA synthetase